MPADWLFWQINFPDKQSKWALLEVDPKTKATWINLPNV